MGRLKDEIVGTMYFDNTIDITDPCYDRDTWGRLNDVKIISGDYECIAWRDTDTNRIMICGIYLDGYDSDTYCESYIGEVGVDAGLCGFFNHKKDYSDSEWDNFCEVLKEEYNNGNYNTGWIYDDGFFTTSGWGDGSYDVYASKNDNGDIIALEIRFCEVE